MIGKVFCGAMVLCCGVATVAAADPDRAVYRFEKRVAAHAWREGSSKLAAEGYFVGLLGVRTAGDQHHVEEFLTGGLGSDLGEALPPRPAGDPLRRTYTLSKRGDVATPLARRASLVVWMLPFEFFLTPHESPAEILAASQGLQEFACHVTQPATTGNWSWRLVRQDVDHGTYEIAGPCLGKFAGEFPLGGSLTRVMAHETGTIREATADLSATIPISARLQRLADSPERQREEEKFFDGYQTLVVRETVRMHRDDLNGDGGIELPLSLTTALDKLRHETDAK
jgi:hypothetical protein